ncbi:hypothetical protein FQR65_LT19870 [Abscondita terminalis]|nr:hypothetical protein FQR65_LT19870 [Abscondita terminalis]
MEHLIILFVGAGSAGAVVASRLSEDPMRYVLLLEAGGNETDFTDIPSMGMHTLNLEYNWNYFTVPQNTSCLGKFEKRCPYPRGKMIGGSSGVNGLGYVRGNKKDFDTWCSQGNPGWCYRRPATNFQKIGKFTKSMEILTIMVMAAT